MCPVFFLIDYIHYNSSYCHVYVIVKEKEYGRTETICGSDTTLRDRTTTSPDTVTPGERNEKHVYLSTGHVVEIRFTANSRNDHYLLKFKGEHRSHRMFVFYSLTYTPFPGSESFVTCITCSV